MALLQISEPGKSPKPHQPRFAIGIDLGTTNSLVATVRGGAAETIPDAQVRHLLPSAVRYMPDASVIVGYDARDQAASDPFNTLMSFKRFMGRGIADVATVGGSLPYQFVQGEGGMPYIHTVAGDISPVQASAEILKVLVKRAETLLGDTLIGAVITVPAYFDDAQRQATRDAASLAGVNVLRLLNEPTAAAVAYGLDQQEQGLVAIYDFGGGTFDISILRLTKGVFEVLATGGDAALGGDDIDRAIAHWILEQAGIVELHGEQQRGLLDTACDAKEKLSTLDAVSITWQDWHGTLDHAVYYSLLDPLIDRTIKACKRTLRDAQIVPADIVNVVMVGGSTRIPRVREKTAELFGRPPLVDIDPDKVVAIGAALQADILAGNKPDSQMLLLDVVPLSLGLETMGGLVERIIPRNTTIPVARAQDFTTYKDGQTALVIHVLQGEREMVDDCRSLARFELRGIPPMVAGAARIRVSFQVDADGLLNVSARENTSGAETHVEVKPSYGLGDGEVARMLTDSFAHAREDIHARKLREQQVDANRLLLALESALMEDGEHLLDSQERADLRVAMQALASARDGDNPDSIALAIDALSVASEEFAARRMNASIRTALTGHTLSELEQDLG